MATIIEMLIADLKALEGTDRFLLWGGWDKTFPPNLTDFREYLIPSNVLLAALTGQPAPPPTTIRVRTTAALNVRSAPVIGDNKVTTLATGTIIEVWEVETVSGWKQIASGTYAGKWVSAQYTERA